MITAPSSLSLEGLAAFSDELEKIAAEAPKGKFKSWAKNTAAAVGGAGAATAAAMGINHLLTPKLAPGWKKLSPRAKALIVAPVVAASGLGSAYLAHRRKSVV